MKKVIFWVVLIIVVAALLWWVFGTTSTKVVTNNQQAQGSANVLDESAQQPQQEAATFTMAQVQSHNDAQSCYAAIRGNVYDLTSWISQHPGGEEAILSLCGTDGTAAFEAQHGGAMRQEQLLETFQIGILATETAQ